jgi:hypothetical protein
MDLQRLRPLGIPRTQGVPAEGVAAAVVDHLRCRRAPMSSDGHVCLGGGSVRSDADLSADDEMEPDGQEELLLFMCAQGLKHLLDARGLPHGAKPC